MKTPCWKPAFYHRFRDQAAGALLPTTANFIAGDRKSAGLPSRSAWLLWSTQSGELAEVVAHRWNEAPLCRISINIGMRRQTWSLIQRLGCLSQRGVYRRDRARLGRHPCTSLATPRAEITCLESELPHLATLAVRIALGCGDLSGIPGAELLLPCDRDAEFSIAFYAWTFQAQAYRSEQRQKGGA